MIYSLEILRRSTGELIATIEPAELPTSKREALAAALDALRLSYRVRLFQGKARALIWEADGSWLRYSAPSIQADYGIGPDAGVLVLREILRKSREAAILAPASRAAFDQILRRSIKRGERQARTAARRAGL